MASGTPPPQCPALNFTYSSAASQFAVTQQAYLSAHPSTEYGYIGTGALVFDKKKSNEPRILLLQRAAGDSMPNKWEVPGGGCDDEDPSLLYSVARELWEEAGFKASHIGAPLGTPHLFMSRSGKRICKFHFVVEVETDAEGNLEPVLDPKEHQRFMWASENEVRSKKVNDEDFEFTTEELLAVILKAFEQFKEQNVA